MANRIKILFDNRPDNYDILSFILVDSVTGYTRFYYKTFIPGLPTNLNQVQIGSTLAATLVNLLYSLNAADTDYRFAYSVAGSELLLDCEGVSYSYTINIKPAVCHFSYDEIPEPEPSFLEPLSIDGLSIQIIDTYENERDVIFEKAQLNVPVLSWESGDDLRQALMTSKLVFNILDPDAADGKFLHLLTGDELRYKVIALSVNEAEETQLIWQGFLLPDKYQEPWKNGVFFVNFTAVDMIGALKGKYLQPWYYANRLPIAQLIASILKLTGVEQNILVKPSVIPSAAKWRNINVPLMHYYDDKKYTDAYRIISDVLEANLLQLYSFRGYWFLDGITRRADITGEYLQFDLAGNVLENVVYFKTSKQPMLAAELPVLNGITPWKLVNIDFDAKGDKNLFSENVVKVTEVFGTETDSGKNFLSETDYDNGTVAHYFNKFYYRWVKNTNSDFWLYNENSAATNLADYSFLNLAWQWASATSEYNYTESMALANYLLCREKVFLQPSIKYELAAQFEIMVYSELSDEEFSEGLKEGIYDMIFPFQLFLNSIEFLSNRPSFPDSSKYRFDYSEKKRQGNARELTFKLNAEFQVEETGYAEFRILMAIMNMPSLTMTIRKCTSLKINVVDDYEITESVLAFRDINYSQELKYPIAFTCSGDTSVENSFGIGFSVNNGNYIQNISRAVAPESYLGRQLFFPDKVLKLWLNTWQIAESVFKLLFADQKLSACFVERVSGELEPFTSLYGQVVQSTFRMGYLVNYEGHPLLPKKYKKTSDLVSGDTVKFMQVKYAYENLQDRLSWKIYGFNENAAFNRTLANALHYIQPETLFTLEAEALDLLFPDNLVLFKYQDVFRNFIPTRLTLNLSEGKTKFIATEAKFSNLSDISYE